MSFIKLADGLCVKCDDGIPKPCIGKRDKALCYPTHYLQKHKRSAKGKADDVIYQDLKKEYLAEHPYCELQIDGLCTGRAVDIHHTKGHIGHYLDVSTFKAACRCCHNFVEGHPELAYEKGYSEKRLIIKEE